ncbi:MAG: hypothetical protein EOP50_07210 [Sphingobacteriales bacterium]|nr:MAG: hypothetical protein EOP50_07210 [Sphingobacteriales bacterium]
MSTVPNDIATLSVAREKCQLQLLYSTRYFFKARFGRKFVVGDHHRTICNALERVLRGECRRLIINLAPRYTKTELAVKNFIAHGLSLNPGAKFIHLSYSDTLALDNSEEAKSIVECPEYRALFPEVRIKRDSKAKKKWYTTAGGGVYATSAAGQVTGFGAGAVDEEEIEDAEWEEIESFLSDIDHKQGFAGAIIIDDPIKPEDADSEVKRELVNQRFDSTIRNRANSRNTPIIVIMQRLHPNDLSGYLQRDEEADQWEVLSLPAIQDDGTALWPHKHTIEELLALRRANEIVFERQYMQNPKPKEGLLFAEEDLRFMQHDQVEQLLAMEGTIVFRFAYNDPADEGGDDMAMPIGYLIEAPGVAPFIYIPEVLYNAHGTDVNEGRCIDLLVQHRCVAAQFEGNSAWLLFAKAVRRKVQEVWEECSIRIIKHTTNKHSRILAQSSFIKHRIVFRKDYKEHPEYFKFIRVLTSYMRIQEGAGKAKHDDAPDALAGMAAYFSNLRKDLW